MRPFTQSAFLNLRNWRIGVSRHVDGRIFRCNIYGETWTNNSGLLGSLVNTPGGVMRPPYVILITPKEV